MSDWVTVCTVQGELKASIVKGRLESEGIPVQMDYEAFGKVVGLSVDGIGAMRILVPSSFEGKAKEILKEAGDLD
jgi:hypothetical protein